MNLYFDRPLYDRLRNLLNKARVFWSDPELNAQFEFLCALMDRINDSIQFIECHSEPPKSTEEVYLFILHANAINEAVRTIFFEKSFFAKRMASLGIRRPVNAMNYFSDAWKTTPFAKNGTSAPSDVEFFSYFRALSFAHSCETSRYPFLKVNSETNYSPFVIPNHSPTCLETHKNDMFGVLVYSNKQHKPFYLLVSFAKVKEYLVERFSQLRLIADCIERMERKQQAEWLKRKVIRSSNPIETLVDIVEILSQRKLETHEIKELILLETIPLMVLKSRALIVVKEFRDAIEKSVPQIADAIDHSDYEKLYSMLEQLLHPTIPKSVRRRTNLVWQRGHVFPDSDYINDPIARDAAKELLYAFGFNKTTFSRLSSVPEAMWLLITASWYRTSLCISARENTTFPLFHNQTSPLSQSRQPRH